MPTLQQSPKLNSPTILLVEDDEGVAILERRSLERRGFRVVNVHSGTDAMAQLKKAVFDLIVMDYRLPDGMTGLDLLAQVQSLGLDLPVVMVTGFSNEATVIEALRQGVRDFVPKSAEYLDYLPIAVERTLQIFQTEKRLAQIQTRFQLFIDNSPSIAFIKDEEGCLLYANRKLEEECRHADWLGKTDADLWPVESAVAMGVNDALVRSSGQPHQFEESLTRTDGTVSHWLTYRFPLIEDGGRRLLGAVAIDVTGQRTAEEALNNREQQLRQSQKMEAVGQLAGGVAHDFNNLLTVILGYSDLLLEEPQQCDSAEAIHEIRKAAERAAGLTRQLLAFSRKQVLEPKSISLNMIVSDMKKMLQRLIGENVEVRTTLAADLRHVHADPGQIEQVLMNLAVNARDAMPHGGEINIETANVELGEGYAACHTEVNPGHYVMLAITDTGCGMDAATQSRIFEPFFTTKEIGRGTGLGLATVYGIVNQSGGYISAYSEVGLGTTFKIYLPEVGAAPHAAIPVSSDEIRIGNETVLLVEDEEGVRGIMRQTIQSLGYKVLEANDPLEAIRISESYQGTIHLLLTDVVMPHLNGRRLAELLQPERPEMKVLYISGYTNDAIIRNGILNEEVSFLQKPFSPSSLAKKVRESMQPGPSELELERTV